VFKIRIAFLQALSTALEKMIIVESMLKRDRDEIINSVKKKEPKCHQE